MLVERERDCVRHQPPNPLVPSRDLPLPLYSIQTSPRLDITYTLLSFVTCSAPELIRQVVSLRAEGKLPSNLMVWAVANPIAEHSPDPIVSKIDAGAQVIVTQPPLLWERWEEWTSNAERRGVFARAKVVAGLPIISSARNLDFWHELCDIAHLPEARR